MRKRTVLQRTKSPDLNSSLTIRRLVLEFYGTPTGFTISLIPLLSPSFTKYTFKMLWVISDIVTYCDILPAGKSTAERGVIPENSGTSTPEKTSIIRVIHPV